MSDSPWVKFYPSDWLGGTRGMTASETGIYITLIAMMYEREGYVIEDRPRLARVCGSSPAAFNKVLHQLVEDGKIIRDDGRLTQNRVLEELKNRSDRSTVAAQSARARWDKNGNEINDTADANALQAQCESNAAGARLPEARVVDDAADAGARDDDPVATPAGRAVRDIVDVDVRTAAGWWSVDGEVARWIAEGCDLCLDILPTIRAAMQRRGAQGPPNSPRYFARAVADARAARLAPMPTPANGGHHAQRQQRPDARYDDASRREPIAAWVAGRMGAGPEPAGAG